LAAGYPGPSTAPPRAVFDYHFDRGERTRPGCAHSPDT